MKGLCRDLRTAGGESNEDDLLGSVWLILHTSISAQIRIHAVRHGRVSREELEDIAAEKALDLLRKIDREEWDPVSRTTGEIERYVTMVARNGLIDWRRQERRRVTPREEDRPEWDVPQERSIGWRQSMEPPDLLVQRREFAIDMRDCAETLQPRSRLIWFLRVFAGMSTRQIAVHPEVALKPGHVDVLLQRARQSIRECMERKGHGTGEVPPGAFTELWSAFRIPDGIYEEKE